MAVTTESSPEYANAVAATQTGKNEAAADGGAMKIKRFSFTQGAAAGDANSLLNLVFIPPGVHRVYLDKSYIQWALFGAGRTLDLGWTAYTALDGSTVAADPDGLMDGKDVAAAGNDSGAGAVATATVLGGGAGVGADRSIRFASRSGVTIQAIVLGGTIPAGTVVQGSLCMVSGG